MDIKKIAKICHEVNRAYCQALGDDSQSPWEEAPDWQKESAINGVKFHFDNPDAGPEASHEAWLKEKEDAGWIYGPEKIPGLKQHPCMVPFDQLPVEQQVKDHIFRAIVRNLLGLDPQLYVDDKDALSPDGPGLKDAY